MKRIAVFASGGGTDFQSVIDANEKEKFCEISYLIASKSGIGAIDRARKHGISVGVFAKNDYPDTQDMYNEITYLLNMNRVDYIVLAGWLKIIPESFIKAFENRIINIHPSLIPAFCGAGYYGLKVHESVLAAGNKVTGATVHFVDEEADHGPIILQKAVQVHEGDTPEILQKRVMEQAEWKILPEAINLIGEGRVYIEGNIAHIKQEA